MDIQYRSIMPADMQELVRLIRTELIPMSYTVSPDDATVIAGLPDRFRSGATIVASPKNGGKLLGFIHYGQLQGMLHIDMLVVNPQHRRSGIGLKLLKQAEQNGKYARNLMSVLYVDDVNEKARRFYTREGYEPVRHHPELKVTLFTKPL
ncbi:GNAT family N-acetyltransferase [Paenibacillus herberti]|uniref:N-acetyltransferase domain-containing protein n=1 Tax=Paenibacillus herberti TaxID=1619309 RepID=A0A229P536_9BACL|nr:GNAT family N-acetyltransferase [Paenibacillus herberti]OXM17238.1 hypothetical protein CGZ75_11700 [Paenibacillus herberti]